MQTTTCSRPYRGLKLGAVGAALMMLGACASYHGAAYIQTNPEGAEVADMGDGTVIGVTPVKVWWEEDSETRKFINIRVHKDGYEDKMASFWVSLRHHSRRDALKDPQSVQIDLTKQE